MAKFDFKGQKMLFSCSKHEYKHYGIGENRNSNEFEQMRPSLPQWGSFRKAYHACSKLI